MNTHVRLVAFLGVCIAAFISFIEPLGKLLGADFESVNFSMSPLIILMSSIYLLGWAIPGVLFPEPKKSPQTLDFVKSQKAVIRWLRNLADGLEKEINN